MQYVFTLCLPLFIFAQNIQTRTQAHMGTFAQISLPKQNNKQISQSFQLIKEIEYSLSSYDREALVYKLNHTHKVKPTHHLLSTIRASKQYYQDTYGYYDITIGSISKNLYHFGENNDSIPNTKSLQKAVRNINAIDINATHISMDDNITIDLGGIGKGYTVDMVANFLGNQNISKGIIALSGDIRCLGLCTLELQSPFSEQTFFRFSSLKPDLSVSTSGTYRRYVQSKENHHLINPKTATQGQSFVSVSLITDANNTKIDAYATAISVMHKDTALSFLKSHNEIGFVLVENNGKIVYGNLEKFITGTWLHYKEKVTIPSTNKKTSTNKPIEINLIHPDTTNPSKIGR